MTEEHQPTELSSDRNQKVYCINMNKMLMLRRSTTFSQKKKKLHIMPIAYPQ